MGFDCPFGHTKLVSNNLIAYAGTGQGSDLLLAIGKPTQNSRPISVVIASKPRQVNPPARKAYWTSISYNNVIKANLF